VFGDGDSAAAEAAITAVRIAAGLGLPADTTKREDWLFNVLAQSQFDLLRDSSARPIEAALQRLRSLSVTEPGGPLAQRLVVILDAQAGGDR
jgi:hypothetical protein